MLSLHTLSLSLPLTIQGQNLAWGSTRAGSQPCHKTAATVRTQQLPGHKDGGVHCRGVISRTRNLVVPKVLCTAKLFMLPVAEALQRSLPMVPHVQLSLEEMNGDCRKGGGEKERWDQPTGTTKDPPCQAKMFLFLERTPPRRSCQETSCSCWQSVQQRRLSAAERGGSSAHNHAGSRSRIADPHDTSPTKKAPSGRGSVL